MPRSLLVPWLPCLLLLCQPGTTASAQTPPATVVDIRVEQEGQVVSDPLILGLIETKAGAPLSVADVRESITHLTSLTRFEDVQVFEETGASGVRLRYVLFPIHAVDRLEFRGTLGLPEADLRHAVTDRFGPAPPAARACSHARPPVSAGRESSEWISTQRRSRSFGAGATFQDSRRIGSLSAKKSRLPPPSIRACRSARALKSAWRVG